MDVYVSQFVELLMFAVDGATRQENEDPMQKIHVDKITWDALIERARVGADQNTMNILDVWARSVQQ